MPMIFPLEKLVEFTDNMYSATSATMKRAYQLSVLREPEVEKNDGKVVSMAARQVFGQDVRYSIED